MARSWITRSLSLSLSTNLVWSPQGASNLSSVLQFSLKLRMGSFLLFFPLWIKILALTLFNDIWVVGFVAIWSLFCVCVFNWKVQFTWGSFFWWKILPFHFFIHLKLPTASACLSMCMFSSMWPKSLVALWIINVDHSLQGTCGPHFVNMVAINCWSLE